MKPIRIKRAKIAQTKVFFRDLAIIVGSCIVMAIVLSLFTGRNKLVIPKNLTENIDSLKAETARLKKAQEKLDSLSAVYDEQIKDVEARIAGIKEKTTIIREYYHTKIAEADKYTQKEIEDFLKNRYK